MKNIAVFFGGRSVEHDVSIISAVQAMKYFDPSQYAVFPVYITVDNEFYYSELFKSLGSFKDKNALLSKSQRVVFTKDTGTVEMLNFPIDGIHKNVISTIDVAFPIVHGTNVEDGILQGYFKTLDIPFVGCDVLSSAIGMDKYVMKVLLHSEGFPVLPGMRFSRNDERDSEQITSAIEQRFPYPVIVKPVNLGSSVGITKANNHEELLKSINNAFDYSSKILVEHAITHLKEVNCSVLGDSSFCEVSELEEPITSHEILDFEEKYISGAKKTTGAKGMASLKRKIPAEIPPQQREIIIKTAQRAFRYLECCGVIRIDFMIDMDNGEVYLNEINTIPGSLAFYLWEPKGISYSMLIEHLINIAINRYNSEKIIRYDYQSNILMNMTGNAAKL